MITMEAVMNNLFLSKYLIIKPDFLILSNGINIANIFLNNMPFLFLNITANL